MTVTFHPARWLLGALLALVSAAAGAQIIRPIAIKPLPLPDPESFVEISAGLNHTCARKLNGKTYCWGRNDQGQIGFESTQQCSGVACVARPRYVMTGRQVEAGGAHSCAIDTAGAAWCWGSDSHGQLGNAPDPYSVRPTPFPVSGGHQFNTISAGDTSTCGTSPEGLFCWGSIAGSAALPLQLSTNGSFQSVSVGGAHACALYVVNSYRGAYCWGQNQYGQSGVDWNAWSGAVPFAFNSSLGTAVARLQTQGDFTCADQINGQVQCTGLNQYGQLGSGQSFSATYVPQTVGVAMTLAGVATGWNHGCALDPNGLASCWGNGYWGQLGNAASNVFRAPQPVAGGRSYRAIASGFQHSCAIGTDNRIYCWGDNRYGQLGLGQGGSWYWTPIATLDPV
jgi:alpha-tubulin suppressor-like RCC1 family protein